MRPAVSIVILTFNRLAYTKACLGALYPIMDCDDELVVWDNASTDGTGAWLKSEEAIQDERMCDGRIVYVYLSDTNLGFAGGNNAAAKLSKHGLLLFLNNDTIPATGFIDALYDAFLDSNGELDESVGAVGAKLLYPDGRIQHMGVNDPIRCMDEQRAPHFGIGLPDTFVMDPQRPVEVDAVTGACLMTTRTWWDRLQGFDERFEMGQYEDVDFCMRIKKAGGKVLYQPKAVLCHFEHVSFTPEANAKMQDNFLKLKLKHQDDSKKPFKRRTRRPNSEKTNAASSNP